MHEFKNLHRELQVFNSVSDSVFTKCSFSSMIRHESLEFLQFSNIKLLNCKAVNNIVCMSNFSEITVDNLNISGILNFILCSFNHCVIKGKAGVIRLSNNHIGLTLDQQLEFIKILDTIHRNCEWAIDIRDADIEDFDNRGAIPIEKIKINNETQVIVDFNKLKEVKDHPDELIQSYLELHLVRYNQDFIFSSSRKSKLHQDDMEYMSFLRSHNCIIPQKD